MIGLSVVKLKSRLVGRMNIGVNEISILLDETEGTGDWFGQVLMRAG